MWLLKWSKIQSLLLSVFSLKLFIFNLSFIYIQFDLTYIQSDFICVKSHLIGIQSHLVLGNLQDEGKGGALCSFLKIEKKVAWFCKKSTLFVIIHGLHSHLKCSFKNILEKKHQIFLMPFFVCHTWNVLIKVPLFQKTFPALKNSWLRTCYLYSVTSYIL